MRNECFLNFLVTILPLFWKFKRLLLRYYTDYYTDYYLTMAKVTSMSENLMTPIEIVTSSNDNYQSQDEIFTIELE